ncbi:MAG TPA: lysylphosphatidylglycerol synthase transmembrane domain-containing protein [Gemmatimonadales bacterium]|nr:lysylphosphatidylglycerol synthase transmembrane domain-containing protein [Gemmatimonadales bacterium]
MRRGLILRGAVSVSLLGYLLAQVGWRTVWDELRRAHAGYLALNVALALAATCVSALKWHALARSRGIGVTLPRCVGLYLVGGYFSQFLPTIVGGDVVRAYELGKSTGRHADALASVLMERYTGMATLVALSGLALAARPDFLTEPLLPLAVLLGALVVTGLGVAVCRPFGLDLVERALPVPPVRGFAVRLRLVRRALRSYRAAPRAVLVSIAYSVLFYGTVVLVVHTGAAALGQHLALATLAVTVPFLLLLMAAPISIGGIGVQEWAYYFMLAKVGVPVGVGLSLGLVVRVRTLAFGILGGVVYLLIESAPPKAVAKTAAAVAAGPPPVPGQLRDSSRV